MKFFLLSSSFFFPTLEKLVLAQLKYGFIAVPPVLGKGRLRAVAMETVGGVKWQVSDLVVKIAQMMDYGGVTRQSKRKREMEERIWSS